MYIKSCKYIPEISDSVSKLHISVLGLTASPLLMLQQMWVIFGSEVSVG